MEQAIASGWLHKHFPPPPKRKQQQPTEAQAGPRRQPLPPSTESEPNSVAASAAAKAIPNATAELDPNPDSQSDSKETESNSIGATAAVEKGGGGGGNDGVEATATVLEDKVAGLVKGGGGMGKEEEEEEVSLEQLQLVEKEPSLENRLLSSMRSYRSYGVFRRVALMVVAYHQSPSKLTDLRNEFVDFDTVSDATKQKCSYRYMGGMNKSLVLVVCSIIDGWVV